MSKATPWRYEPDADGFLVNAKGQFKRCAFCTRVIRSGKAAGPNRKYCDKDCREAAALERKAQLARDSEKEQKEANLRAIRLSRATKDVLRDAEKDARARGATRNEVFEALQGVRDPAVLLARLEDLHRNNPPKCYVHPWRGTVRNPNYRDPNQDEVVIPRKGQRPPVKTFEVTPTVIYDGPTQMVSWPDEPDTSWGLSKWHKTKHTLTRWLHWLQGR